MTTNEMYRIILNLDDNGEIYDVKFEEIGEFHIYVKNTNRDFLNKDEWKYRDLDDERTGRHLDTAQFKTFIHCKLPRIIDKNGSIKTIDAPGARKGSRFTMMLEALIIELASYMPIACVAKRLNEYDQMIGKSIFYGAFKARGFEDFSNVKFIGVDETGFKKFHRYITVIVDSQENKVLCVVNGKDSRSVKEFVDDFKNHGGNVNNIELCTCDMSIPFKTGIEQYLPNAKMVIDKFHVIKHMNEGLNQVRRDESKDNVALKKSRYILLKNEKNLTPKQTLKKDEILSLNPNTATAYSIKLKLEEIYLTCYSSLEAKEAFENLISLMLTSELEPMLKLAQMYARRLDDICRYFSHGKTNAILECINSIIQAAKAKARGFKVLDYFKAVIYLIASKLDFNKTFGDPMVTKYLHLKS